MKQDISNYGPRVLLARHHMVPQGIAITCLSVGDVSLHQDECAVPSTPRTRQIGFKDALHMEGAKRLLTARLHVEGNFDDLGPDPAAAPAKFAQRVGAAGLAGLPTLRPRMSSEISV